MGRGIIEITGLDDFYDLIRDLDDETRKEVSEVIEDHLNQVAITAETLVPVDSGLLKGSIETDMSKSGLSGVVKTNARSAPHGHLVHFGTARMAGRPFLYQAAERHERQFETELEKMMDQIVQRKA